MAKAKVGILIEAEDRASSVLSGIKGRMGTLQSKVQSMKPAFQTMALAGTAAFAGLSVAVYKSIEASAEAAKVQAQLGAVLKSTGEVAGITAEKAIALSKALQKQTTFGDEAILSAENMLLTFTNISKDIFPDATKMVLDMSVALGQDLKSSSIQLGKALNDPILGMTALRRVGVNFNNTQVDIVKAMVASGDTMKAQKYILNELGTEFGGSASAQAGTFAGKMMQLKEIVSDLQQGIGDALVPIISSLLAKVTPVIEKITEWIEKNPQLTKYIILGSLALTGLVAVVGLLGLAIIVVSNATAALGITFAGVLSATGVGLVIAGIILIANNLKNIIGALYGVEITWKDVWESIKSSFKDVTDWIADRILWVMDKINVIKNAYKSVIDTIGGVVNKGKELIVGGTTQNTPVSTNQAIPYAPKNSSNSYNFQFNGDITDKNEFASKVKDIFSQVLSVKQVMPQ